MKSTMKLKINSSAKIKLIGILIGALTTSSFATLQHIMVFGVIKPQAYIIPMIVGGLAGFFIAYWFNKLAEAKKEIHDSHDRLKMVLKGTEIGMWDWNPQTKEVHFDEQWCHLIGYKLNELPQHFHTWESRVHPEDLPQSVLDINAHLNEQTPFFRNVHRMKHKDGHWVYIMSSGQVTERNANNQAVRFIGTHTDITHLKEVEQALESSNKKLKKLSLIDGLTGLSNRHALEEFFDKEWGHWKESQTPFSILMIDIDFFKHYNDTYGHLVGDDCLKQVAKVLSENVKRTHDIATRFGGEEFLIVLSGVQSDEAEKIAEKIRHDIENLKIDHSASQVSQYVTVSVGVSYCAETLQKQDTETAISEADQALYKAKEQGRNQVVLNLN